jgi:hypothetical protein
VKSSRANVIARPPLTTIAKKLGYWFAREFMQMAFEYGEAEAGVENVQSLKSELTKLK